MISGYEAGRDGFWLHRFLAQGGVRNLFVDSASIEVSRPKSDRLDATKLVSMLIRWHHGEERVWAMVRVPTVDDEDRRRSLGHAPSCRFSMWARGYMGRHTRAGKSKAVHASARRIGKALYYCHLKNEPFDDSGYDAPLSESRYPLCPVEEMGLSAGVDRNLKRNGLLTSRRVVDAFYSDLGRRPGCGKATVQAVSTWVNSHRNASRGATREPKQTRVLNG